MTARRKREYRILAVTAGLIALAMAIRIYSRAMDGPSPLSLRLSRSAIYIGLMSAWGISVRRRILPRQVRRYLSVIAALMVLWLLLRTVKYSLPQGCTAARYLWYGYYLPMLFIPTVSVFVALSLGRAEDYRLPRWVHALYVPAAALLLLVLTNDVHRLVFSFPAGTMSDAAYTYAPGYYPVIGWAALCALSAFGIMVYKCRLPHSKTYLFRPLLPIGLLGLYCLGYASGVHWLWAAAGDMTVTLCLAIAAILESCIRCGLIPSNTGYEELFRAATIGAQITDRALHVCYASAGAKPLSPETLAAAVQSAVPLDRNTLLRSHGIEGGHVFWLEDITELADATERLELTQEELRETGDILKAENEQKARYLHLQEQNRLYDRIEQETARQLALLNDRLVRLRAAESLPEARRILWEITVVGTYVKRRSNLIFAAGQKKTLSADELRLCLNESAGSLALGGTDCRITVKLNGSFPAPVICGIYDVFEAVVEESLPSLRSLLLYAEADEAGRITARIGAACPADLSALGARFPSLSLERDEDAIWYLTFTEGGT